MFLSIPQIRIAGCFALAAAMAGGGGCRKGELSSGRLSPGTVIDRTGMAELYRKTAGAIASAPIQAPGQGSAGAAGGARVKFLRSGLHELIIALPQSDRNQVPVTYALAVNPESAAGEFRLRTRGDGNVVAGLRLEGERDQEIEIRWAAVVLVASRPAGADSSDPGEYLRATACVQSGDKKIRSLARQLNPENGDPTAYAAAIQRFITGMRQVKPPISLDAAGILESGSNWICTANANLAAALLRAGGVPARSMAVIPATGQRMEMHRIVEYFSRGRWQAFDPSSLLPGIPVDPARYLVMSRTTIADEEAAMKPRMGVSRGVPYGQELEFLDGGLAFAGRDFFWTTAKPQARFEVGEEAFSWAEAAWSEFLRTGRLAPDQIRAAAADDAGSFSAALSNIVEE
ncbi:MAG: transglutaminase domain-containing protein [Candidatus Erginobacter occultus]|nr:transglutaminase domain-containing protein [Candidatus Erginobacter occultus]